MVRAHIHSILMIPLADPQEANPIQSSLERYEEVSPSLRPGSHQKIPIMFMCIREKEDVGTESGRRHDEALGEY